MLEPGLNGRKGAVMERQEIAIVDIRIPFLSLLMLMVKLALVAVPIFTITWILIGYVLFALNNLPRLM